MTLRVIPALDQKPKFVEQAQTPGGKIAILFLFAGPLWLLNAYWWQMLLVLVTLSMLPQYRRQILLFVTPAVAVLAPDWIPMDAVARVIARAGLSGSVNPALAVRIASAFVLLLLALTARALYAPRKQPALKRPLVVFHLLFAALVVAACLLPLQGMARVAAWTFLFALSGYFWYFCYTVLDRTAKGHDPWQLQAETWQPAWTLGASPLTPFVRGAAYLRQIEAKTSEELAVTQLKGLKLIWWALILRIVLQTMLWGLHGSLLPKPLPTYDAAFSASVAGHPYSALTCWATLIAVFLENLLVMSTWGHQIVACCRMAGFRALRNTFRPLESRTIAEFWNRYYFYFKELLVNVFFYPTFTRYFRRQPKLRKFAATMAAATFGNMLAHYFRDIYFFSDMGLWPATRGFHVYAVYCLILGIAIGISQIRPPRQEDPSASWLRRRLWPAICVGGFYCLLHIFDDTARDRPITQHIAFLVHLFDWRS